MDRLEALREHIEEKLSMDKSQDPAHDVDHIMRVYENGKKLTDIEGANWSIVAPSILLHDVIRPNDPELEKRHSKLSAEYAQKILPSYGYSLEEVKHIIHCILASSRSSFYEIPKTKEAMIVFDADKLDGGGEIGIKRTLALTGVRGYTTQEAARWYLGRIIDIIKNQSLFTETAKKLAKEKFKISIEFCKKHLGEEYNQIIKKEFGNSKIKKSFYIDL